MAGSAKLEGPLYEPPKGSGTLSPTEVGGPKGAVSIPDPLNFSKTKSK
jgi:hypothetical protein